MARIPRYVQDALASQAVGTPGLDQSANILSNAQQNATNQLAYSDMQNQVSNVQGLGGIASGAIRAISAGIKLQRTQQTLLNQGAVAEAMYQFSQELDKNEDFAKRANINNPTATSQAFRSPAEFKLQNFLHGLEKQKFNRQVINQVNKMALSEIKTRSHSLTNWGFEQAKVRTKESMTVLGNELPNQLGAADNVDDFLKKRSDVTQYAAKFAEAGMGEDQSRFWDAKTARDGALQFLKVQSENNPQLIEGIVNREDFVKQSGLRPTDIEKAKDDAVRELNVLHKKTIDLLKNDNALKISALSDMTAISDDYPTDNDQANNALRQVDKFRMDIRKLPAQAQVSYAPALAKADAEHNRLNSRIKANDKAAEQERKAAEREAKADAREGAAAIRAARTEQRWNDYLENKEEKKKLETPEAVNMADTIAAKAKMLATKADINKDVSPREAEFARSLIQDIDRARSMGFVTASGTREYKSLAEATLQRVIDKYGNKATSPQIQKQINESKRVLTAPTPELMHVMNPSKDPKVTKDININWTSEVQKTKEAFIKRNGKQPTSEAAWQFIYQQTAKRFKPNAV